METTTTKGGAGWIDYSRDGRRARVRLADIVHYWEDNRGNAVAQLSGSPDECVYLYGVPFDELAALLLHNQTRPIFLIVDQHSSHRAKVVQEFVASTDGRLELFFLPPYSPELNPDELVWNHLKTHGVRKRLLQTPEDLKRYVLSHMWSLQRTPARLRGFFKKPSLRYITA